MKCYGRFQKGGETFYGIVEDGTVHRLDGNPMDQTSDVKVIAKLSLEDLKILVPSEPTKIVAVGLNYADHAKETKLKIPSEPLIWFKAPSSLIPHLGDVQIAYRDHRTDFEAELCIVIGKKAKGVKASDADPYIFGYTCSQDITDRTIQATESQWGRAKSLDTYTPVGPFIQTGIDPSNLGIQLFQNGKCMQNSRTSELIFKIPGLIEFISQHITLMPGDLILTGTPSGIAPINPGDELEVRIEGLKPLKNRVV